MHSAGSGDGLKRDSLAESVPTCDSDINRETYSLLCDCRAVFAENKLLACACELLEACNRQILVVKIRIIPDDLVGLALVSG